VFNILQLDLDCLTCKIFLISHVYASRFVFFAQMVIFSYSSRLAEFDIMCSNAIMQAYIDKLGQ
jgi:hypothetical protein